MQVVPSTWMENTRKETILDAQELTVAVLARKGW